MADNNSKLEQFISVTGVDEERARFYMESAAWELEVALGSFYEHDGEESPDVIPVVEDLSSSSPTNNPSDAAAVNPITKPKPRSKNTNSKFATLQNLSSSSEDEDEGQAFYAGGSERSGQQVLGPPKKKDIVSDMFSAIKRHGVELLDSNASGSSSGTFKGTAYKLGQTESDSERLPGAPEPLRPEQVTLKLWSDGFSVNEGELRHYTDPANRDFLFSISRGEIPAELQQGSSEVHLAMEDHRMETFGRTKFNTKYRAFAGHGHTLGSPAPAIIGAPVTQELDRVANETQAKRDLTVDTSQPTTNIRIRLADGTRLVEQFNHSHTVGEIRTYIMTARPQYETARFSLLSCYPSRELQDSETLSEAGLLNSAIMQKLV